MLSDLAQAGVLDNGWDTAAVWQEAICRGWSTRDALGFGRACAMAASVVRADRLAVAASVGESLGRWRAEVGSRAVGRLLDGLARDEDAAVRGRLAEALVGLPDPPLEVLGRLGFDAPAVATPVLLAAPLPDAVLLDVLACCGEAHADTIVRRGRLGHSVLGVLLTRGSSVRRAVLGRHAAQLEPDVLAELVAESFDDPFLWAELLQRPALPFAVVLRQAGLLAEGLELGDPCAGRLPAAVLDALALDLPERGPGAIPADAGDGDTTAFLRLRHARNDLGPETPLGFLAAGDPTGCEAALAVRAGIRPRRARRLLHGIDPRAPAALAVAAGLGSAHHLLLRATVELARRTRRGQATDRAEWLGFLQEVAARYERLRPRAELVRQLVEGGPGGGRT